MKGVLYVVGLVLCSMLYAVHAQYQELHIRSHSLQAPYIDADLSNRFWEFGGSTVVSTNQYIRLTPDRQSKNGWLWSKLPFTYQHWMIEFEFKVEGQGYRVFGDGFAFWFTKERAETGPVFGSRDHWHGLGIFFDTYANAKHRFTFPYVSAMYNDGYKSFSIDDDNEKNSYGGCEAQFRKQNWPTKARVKYLMGRIYVYLDIKGKNEWEECFQIEYLDLTGPHYIGFTGMTGDVADNHDILRVSSYMITLPPHEQQQFELVQKQRQAGAPTSVVDYGQQNLYEQQQQQQQHQETVQQRQQAWLEQQRQAQQQQQQQQQQNQQQPPPPQQNQPHDWQQQVLNKAQQQQQDNQRPPVRGREKVKSEGLSGTTYFLILVVVAFVCGIGFLFIKTQRKKNNKKF